MPRLRKPPAEQLAAIEVEDHSTPTEDIMIELPDDEVVDDAQISLAPQPEQPVTRVAPAEGDDAVTRAAQATQRAEQLQRDLAESNRQRDEMARQSRQREQELSRDRDDAQYNSVLTAMAAEQSAMDKATSDLESAVNAGNAQEMARAQREISVAAARLDRLDESKRSFDTRRADPPPRETTPQPQQRDFETLISTLPDTAKAWLRDHPELINDNAKNQKLQNAHQYLVSNKGLGQFSPEYFAALDAEFGFKQPTVEDNHQPQQRRSMPVTAPVSRDVPTSNGQRQSSGTIKLTAEERIIARNSFGAIKDASGNMVDLTNEQKEMLYARNKQKRDRMMANGQYRDERHQQ